MPKKTRTHQQRLGDDRRRTIPKSSEFESSDFQKQPSVSVGERTQRVDSRLRKSVLISFLAVFAFSFLTNVVAGFRSVQERASAHPFLSVVLLLLFGTAAVVYDKNYEEPGALSLPWLSRYFRTLRFAFLHPLVFSSEVMEKQHEVDKTGVLVFAGLSAALTWTVFLPFQQPTASGMLNWLVWRAITLMTEALTLPLAMLIVRAGVPFLSALRITVYQLSTILVLVAFVDALAAGTILYVAPKLAQGANGSITTEIDAAVIRTIGCSFDNEIDDCLKRSSGDSPTERRERPEFR